MADADKYVLAQAQGRPVTIEGRYEACVVLNRDTTRQDLDNPIKSLLDYAQRIELVRSDGPNHLQRLPTTQCVRPAARSCAVLP
jgi:hypothetical protein